MDKNIKSIIECIFFVSEAPLSITQIKKVIPNFESKEITEAILDLKNEYEHRKGGFYLCEVAGGYQFRTRPEYKEWVALMVKPSPIRLSKAALETLAIIAYKQPVIRSDIEYIRGVDSGNSVRLLLERKLIKILGRKDVPGRPIIYGTSKEFLEIFGLKDIKDLPFPQDIPNVQPLIQQQKKMQIEQNISLEVQTQL
ncbi:MAG: SMC-Scp complex subunit ScpB [Desulfobacterales bacterium]|nr:SMC-Scp complex subunit ScpB [Desulfobacterales bacterium]